ncbi:MAG TPA: outer membrane protein assembly factor BamD [Alphaproteobacteria bacterium]
MIRLSRPFGRPALAIAALLAIGPLALGLGACSNKKDDYLERPVEQIYNQATDLLLDRNYLQAAKQFDEVERQHPYSVWATKAQLMAAYANYQANKYDDAVVALDRFIQLNPSNRDVAYAYYMKALCYYEQITDVQRDAKMTEQALKSLEEVVNRFPESVYGRDARLKIDLTHDHLAGKEMDVGRYYLTRAQYLAALNRFKFVVDKYQTTSHVPEALHRMIECYLALGLKEEAKRTAAVLGYNYPGSQWYMDSYSLVETGQLPAQDGEGPGLFRRALNTLPF